MPYTDHWLRLRPARPPSASSWRSAWRRRCRGWPRARPRACVRTEILARATASAARRGWPGPRRAPTGGADDLRRPGARRLGRAVWSGIESIQGEETGAATTWVPPMRGAGTPRWRAGAWVARVGCRCPRRGGDQGIKEAITGQQMVIHDAAECVGTYSIRHH